MSSSAGSSAWGGGHYNVQPPRPTKGTGSKLYRPGLRGRRQVQGRVRGMSECVSPPGAAGPVRRLGQRVPTIS